MKRTRKRAGLAAGKCALERWRTMPSHIYARWRHFNCLIDSALAAELPPWSVAEAACEAIWTEWAVSP